MNPVFYHYLFEVNKSSQILKTEAVEDLEAKYGL